MIRDRYILSIDGGGIRGIIPAKVFELTGIKAELFDVIVGSSIGGIIATALNFYMPYQVTELLKEHAKDIFELTMLRQIKTVNGIAGAKYDVKNLKKVLQEIFQETKFCDCHNHTLLTSYDIKNRKPKIFKSSQDNLKIYDACSATAAAPTYFMPVKTDEGIFIDGGTFFNNPTLIGILEAQLMFPHDKLHVLSLGTGTSQKEIKINNGGIIEWTKDIIDVFMDANTEGIDYMARKFFPNINYLRLQTNTESDIKLDDVDSIDILENTAKKLFSENFEKINNWKKCGGLI